MNEPIIITGMHRSGIRPERAYSFLGYDEGRRLHEAVRNTAAMRRLGYADITAADRSGDSRGPH